MAAQDAPRRKRHAPRRAMRLDPNNALRYE